MCGGFDGGVGWLFCVVLMYGGAEWMWCVLRKGVIRKYLDNKKGLVW